MTLSGTVQVGQVSVLLLGLVAATNRGAALAKTPSQPKAAGPLSSVAKTRAVSGVVQEFYSRAPYPGLRLRLKSYSGTCNMPEMTTVTDQEGRFRFDDVPPCSQIGPHLQAQPCEKCMTQDAMEPSGRAIDVAMKTNLGTVLVADDTWPVKQFAGLCDGKSPVGDVPSLPNNIAMLYWNDRTSAWTSTFLVSKKWLGERILSWPGVLCLKSTYTTLGEYQPKDGRPTGFTGRKGMRVETHATLVRLRDGARFETSASADPPEISKSTFGDEYGDTDTPVRSWLRKVTAENP